jgi:hypothetical protein
MIKSDVSINDEILPDNTIILMAQCGPDGLVQIKTKISEIKLSKDMIVHLLGSVLLETKRVAHCISEWCGDETIPISAIMRAEELELIEAHIKFSGENQKRSDTQPTMN